MAAAALFFSLMSVFVKAVGQRLPTMEVVLGRGVVTLALSWVTVRRVEVSPWGRRRGLLLLRGLFGFAALSCFYYAVIHLPLADATVIQYTNPIFTALIAALVLAEGMGTIELFCVLASLAGIVLVARPTFLFGAGASLDPVAVGVGLAGAVLSAAAYVSVRRLGASEHPYVIVFWFALITVVGSAPVAAPTLLWPTPLEWAGLAAVGITTQIAQVYMTRGLGLERAGRATAVGYLQIVFAGVWGVLFFRERPDLLGVLGASLIVAGTFLLARRRREARTLAGGGTAP